MNSSTIRQTFLDFFNSKGHTIVPSAPMVVRNDPTLMFTNAGMNQFKDIFLGHHDPDSKRVADTQKCLRVSGKHNDLEEVGHDTYHHTMFEMLGNWSFGDYFKQEAIRWGWELLTSVYGIDPGRLYVTVFEGDAQQGLEIDRESYDCWKELVPEERILMGSRKDNFWEMGDTGPCGPCSEIHADIRDDAERALVPGSTLVNTGHPQVIEIWNLVFIQFNRLGDGSLQQLPARHVDTGMGFERLCMVLQGKKSNYDTDVFQPVIGAIGQRTGILYGEDPQKDVAMRVMADHLRAIAFSIADGQLPSNVRAGYVIRRILRRAVRYGYVFLDIREPFLCGLVPALIAQMGSFFPELAAQENLITHVIREEESSFLRTLSSGISKFESYIGSRSQDEGNRTPVIPGAFAFELFDTYGFPVDLTCLMAREKGWQVDMEGFVRDLEAQKSRSRQAASVEATDWVILQEEAGLSLFIGYDTLQVRTLVTRYRKVTSKGDTLYHIVLAETPFYAESGGQVGDRGQLIQNGTATDILNTIRENDLIIHLTAELPPDPSAEVIASVDPVKRRLTANNHSATHLLHAALRSVLGTHVEQKGSLVDENRLRFDFTHFQKMTPEEIRKVERMVNARIRENLPAGEHRSVPIAQAREMGAMALFGEKYGDLVRVITFDPEYSVELCGGTHVTATGQIGLLKIVSEGAIAAGIRRIEAVTADRAEEYWEEKETLLEEVSELLRGPKDLLRGLTNLVDEYQELRKQVSQLSRMKAGQIRTELVSSAAVINGITFIAASVELDSDSIKNLAFELRNEIPDLYLVIASEHEGKAGLTVAIADRLVKEKGMHAGNIIRALAKEVDGGGGGQPHIATAGGKNPSGIPAALKKAESFIP